MDNLGKTINITFNNNYNTCHILIIQNQKNFNKIKEKYGNFSKFLTFNRIGIK